MSRRAAGEGSIHKLPDGRWRATVDLPPLDGRRRRRSVTGRTRKEAADKLTRLRKAAADGATLGDSMTVEAWLNHWRTSIAQLKSQTDRGYESKIRVRVVPYIGKVRLDRLTPEHLEKLYRHLAQEGLAPASVLQVHRILHSALRVAEMRRRIPRNPAALVKPPTVPHREAVALTRDQALAALAVAGTRRSAPRWQTGLALGLRQGEALGLTWGRVDLDAGSLAVAAELVWLPYRCGCGDGCKPARRCFRATGGRHVLEEPKSARSRRTLTLPAPLVDALRAWRVTQLQERLALGEKWRGWDHDLVFAQPNGRPTNHRADWGDWQEILDAAGVPRMGTHGGRHTTATLLLEAGESMRVVQEVLGHSSYQLTANVYSHVGETLKRGAAEKMGAALWGEG